MRGAWRACFGRRAAPAFYVQASASTCTLYLTPHAVVGHATGQGPVVHMARVRSCHASSILSVYRCPSPRLTPPSAACLIAWAPIMPRVCARDVLLRMYTPPFPASGGGVRSLGGGYFRPLLFIARNRPKLSYFRPILRHFHARAGGTIGRCFSSAADSPSIRSRVPSESTGPAEPPTRTGGA